ncbi:unnamed protein product [Arctogadus glacialis]
MTAKSVDDMELRGAVLSLSAPSGSGLLARRWLAAVGARSTKTCTVWASRPKPSSSVINWAAQMDSWGRKGKG